MIDFVSQVLQIGLNGVVNPVRQRAPGHKVALSTLLCRLTWCGEINIPPTEDGGILAGTNDFAGGISSPEIERFVDEVLLA